MIIASAGYYGLMPRSLELLGAVEAAAALYDFQASYLGLLVYGALVFCMEFLPFGAVNPQEVSEYFSAVRVGLAGFRAGRLFFKWVGGCFGASQPEKHTTHPPKAAPRHPRPLKPPLPTPLRRAPPPTPEKHRRSTWASRAWPQASTPSTF
jgi:hypothetical protein